jgi:hypothetical protein
MGKLATCDYLAHTSPDDSEALGPVAQAVGFLVLAGLIAMCLLVVGMASR